jgi:ABC-type proline/glycine betaine transport system substrate-binding protein
MMLRRYTLFAILLATILTVSGSDAVSAKGPPDQVNISGPGWGGEFVITDPELLKLLGVGTFEDSRTKVWAPIFQLLNPFEMHPNDSPDMLVRLVLTADR